MKEKDVRSKLKENSYLFWVIPIALLVLAVLGFNISNRIYANQVIDKYDTYLASVDTVVDSHCENIPPAFVDLLNSNQDANNQATYADVARNMNVEECGKYVGDKNTVVALKGAVSKMAIEEFNAGMSERGWYFEWSNSIACLTLGSGNANCSTGKIQHHFNGSVGR